MMVELILFGKILWIIFLLIMSLVFGMLSIAAFIVLVDLIRRGPEAADEAYRSGASLKNWWHGTHPIGTSTRSSFVGKWDAKHGVVMDEASSRRPSWLRRLK